MAKENLEKTEYNKTLTINDGLRFGFGFLLVNLLGFVAIGLVAWLVILVSRFLGLSL